MAQQLIDSLSSDFEPDRYNDTYREKVLDLIERKAEGKEVVVNAEPERPAPVIDLMAALEASLKAAKGETSSEDDGGEAKRPARRAAKRAGRKAS